MIARTRQMMPTGTLAQGPASHRARGRTMRSIRRNVGRVRSMIVKKVERETARRARRAGSQALRYPSASCTEMTISGTPKRTERPGAGTGSAIGSASTSSSPPIERSPRNSAISPSVTRSPVTIAACRMSRSDSRSLAAGEQGTFRLPVRLDFSGVSFIVRVLYWKQSSWRFCPIHRRRPVRHLPLLYSDRKHRRHSRSTFGESGALQGSLPSHQDRAARVAHDP